MRFVNLHGHSTFSFGDGFGLPAAHIRRAGELGCPAIALTDHGNVSGLFQFERAGIKDGVKPIFGCELYCGPTDENRSQWKYHLTALASSAEGYRSLNRIVTQSWKDFYYHPTVSGRTLTDNRDGLIVLSGCSGSLLACTLLGGKGIPEKPEPDLKAAREVIERFLRIFGPNYYLEVQPFHELAKSVAINIAYEKLSRETGVPLVATCDSHYPCADDSRMQAILHAVHRGGASVDDQMRSWNYDVPMTLPESEKEIRERLELTGLSKRAVLQAIGTTVIITERCDVTLPKADPLIYPAAEEDLIPWA